MSFLCVDVVADVVDDALLLENKEETNVFPVVRLAEEETFNAFAVALLCICLRVRVSSGSVRKFVTCHEKRLNFHSWEKHTHVCNYC